MPLPAIELAAGVYALIVPAIPGGLYDNYAAYMINYILRPSGRAIRPGSRSVYSPERSGHTERSLMAGGSRRTIPLPAGWGALCRTILVRDPYCRWGQSGLPDEAGICSAPSEEVDHIGSAWDHSPEMLRGICTWHHLRRSSSQGNAAKAFLRSLRYRPQEKHPGWIREVQP
jgi:5-methylcytosine-specific restriction enzyme A